MEGFDDQPGHIWFNGALVPWKEATVHVLTHAMHYASCVFEGERAYNGRIFKLTEHTGRLLNGAGVMGMDVPYTLAEIDAACNKLVEVQGITDGYIRPVVWRGSEMMGVSAQSARINVAIAAWEWPEYFADRMAGIRMQWAKWRRPDPATIPCHTKAAGLYMIWKNLKKRPVKFCAPYAILRKLLGKNVFIPVEKKNILPGLSAPTKELLLTRCFKSN